MRQLLSYAWAAAMAILALTAQAAQTKTPVKRKTTTASKKKAGSRKAPVKSAKGTTWRNRQLTPSADRYKEIQSALVTKGYLKPEDAGGTWNQASIDGLKKFQADQKIDSSGKINSLSLIALGLGPKHEAAVVKPAEAPQ